MSRLFELLVARPRLSILVVLLAALPIVAGALQMQIDFSPEQVYVGNGDAVEFCEQHKQLFRFEDSLILVLLESTDQNSLLRQDCLEWMKQFAADAKQLEGVRDVTSIVTLKRPRIGFSSGERVTWSPLLAENMYGDTDYLQRSIRRIPLLNDTIVSQDQQLLMTLIDVDPSDRGIAMATKRISAVEDMLRKGPSPAATQTFVSGVPAIRVDVIRSILADQTRMVPICSALFLLVSLLMFRSPVVSALSVLAVLIAAGLTVGMMGWMGITFSVMSNVIPVLVLIIGAANNVHILSRFQVEMRQNKADIRTCVLTTMNEMGRTCFLTLATTAIGFGSLLIAEADLLKSLAIQSATGMGCCYVSLMLITPPTLMICALRLCPSRKPSEHNADVESLPHESGHAHESKLDGIWSRLSKVIGANAIPIVVVHLLIGAWTLYCCRDMAINSYMFETYDGDHPTMDLVRKMDSRLSGLISLEVQLSAESNDRFFDTDVVAALGRIRASLPSDDRVSFYRDYVEFLSEFDRGKTLSNDPDEIESSLKRIKLVLRQLRESDVTSSFLGKEKPVARVMMRIRDIGSAGMKDLFSEVEAVLQKELPSDVKFRLTGDAYLHAVCMDVFVRDLFYSLIAASGIIFLLITVLFRSLKTGLISAVPNMLPLIMTLGYMNLRGYELTAGNVIVFAISLGIAVDDTIHFLARYRDEQKNATPLEAIQGTLSTSGRAIVLTSLLVVSGLSVLIFSDFVPTRRFAELTAVTMCVALPGDVILLPALLTMFAGKQTVGNSQKSEDRDVDAS